MLDWLLEVSPVLLVGAVLGKCVDWLWQKFYVAKRNLEGESARQETEFLQSFHNVINEIDSNCKPGVGDKACPFLFVAHALFVENSNPRLPKETRDSIRRILDEGRLCNADRFQNGVTPNRVKEASRLLKDQLKQLLPAETNLCK